MQINEVTAKELIEEKKRVNDLRVQLHENQTLFAEVMAEAREIILSSMSDDPASAFSASEGESEELGRELTYGDSDSSHSDNAQSWDDGDAGNELRGATESSEVCRSGTGEDAAAWSAMASKSQRSGARALGVSFRGGGGKLGVFSAISFEEPHADGHLEACDDTSLPSPLWNLQVWHSLHENSAATRAMNGTAQHSTALHTSAGRHVLANGAAAAMDSSVRNTVDTSVRGVVAPIVSVAKAAAADNRIAVEDVDESGRSVGPTGSGVSSTLLREAAGAMLEAEARLEFGSGSDSPSSEDSMDVDQLTMDAEALLTVRFICYPHKPFS
jgi:hypothetical protein